MTLERKRDRLVECLVGDRGITLSGFDRFGQFIHYPNDYLDQIPRNSPLEAVGSAILRALELGTGEVTGEPPSGDEMLRLERAKLRLAGVTSRTALARSHRHVRALGSGVGITLTPSYVDKPSQGFIYSRWLEDEVVSDPTPETVGAAFLRALDRCRVGVPKRPAAKQDEASAPQ